MVMLGNYWQALVIMGIQVFFTSTIDNILRPLLVPKEVVIHPALLLLSFIGGNPGFWSMGFPIWSNDNGNCYDNLRSVPKTFRFR